MADMRLIVVGAGGRMGRTLVKAIAETMASVLAGAIEPGARRDGARCRPARGPWPNGITAESPMPRRLLAKADGIIDFTVPAATVAHAALAAQHKLVHIIGTTGLSADDEGKIAAAGKSATIVKSGNMSMGVNLLAALVERVAKTLGDDFDIEVVEMHHNKKVDAPSGTALLLGRAAAEGRNIDLKTHSDSGRDGIAAGARKASNSSVLPRCAAVRWSASIQ